MKNPPHEACVHTGNVRLPVEATPDGTSGLGHMIPVVEGFFFFSHRDVFWSMCLYLAFLHSCLKWTFWERETRKEIPKKNG